MTSQHPIAALDALVDDVSDDAEADGATWPWRALATPCPFAARAALLHVHTDGELL